MPIKFEDYLHHIDGLYKNPIILVVGKSEEILKVAASALFKEDQVGISAALSTPNEFVPGNKRFDVVYHWGPTGDPKDLPTLKVKRESELKLWPSSRRAILSLAVCLEITNARTVILTEAPTVATFLSSAIILAEEQPDGTLKYKSLRPAAFPSGNEIVI